MSPDPTGVVNEELRQILQDVRHDAADAQVADDAEAEVARADGVLPTYFDLAVHLELADVCWALGDWGEARRWYRHNAEVMQEKRAWHEAHSGADYPIDATIDWEAATFVKAGDLDGARRLLPRAIRLRREQPGSELVLARLGLHAAQAGLTDLVPAVAQVIAARQQLPGDSGPDAEDVRAHLHYEPAEVDLLLGRWE